MASSSTASETKTRTLRSSDGGEFLVRESAVALSVMVKHRLTGSLIPIVKVGSKTLSKVAAYMKKHGDESVSSGEKKQFDVDLLSSESIEELMNLNWAAFCMGIKDLQEIVAREIANAVKHETVERVREIFGWENDYTPEEDEEKLRMEHPWLHQMII